MFSLKTMPSMKDHENHAVKQDLLKPQSFSDRLKMVKARKRSWDHFDESVMKHEAKKALQKLPTSYIGTDRDIQAKVDYFFQPYSKDK